MTKRTLWRLITTLLICLGCGWFFLPLNKVRLGLDLRGGVHFELEVQGQEALEADLRDHKDRIQDRLREKSFPTAAVKVEGMALRVDGIPADQKDAAQKVLDGFGGYKAEFKADHVLLTQTEGYQKGLKDSANKQALLIIENRINQFGVAEPEITPSGAEGNRIVVELPGVGEAERERIKGLLSTPGRLEQRLVAEKTSPAGYRTREEAQAAFGGQLPPDTELIPEPENEPKDAQKAVKAQAEPKILRWYIVETKTRVDGADIANANRSQNPDTGFNEIHFTLNHKGAEDFYELSKIASDQQRMIAVILDRKIVSVLSCDKPIPGGSVSISNRVSGFTQAYADDFALKLKSGAMRASMKFLEESSVSASLGADSIRSGVIASLIGFGTIIIFMLIFYHWSGMNAIVALTVNLIVMLGLLGSFHATLTLPGIAGFALTLGMAVDANILIYERIKEEMAAGKSIAGAIQAGFDRVFWTIVDAHVTQLVAAVLLFSFGTGPVKGFAVTLAVGVIASLFTSIYISRYIYDWILERHPGATSISIGSTHFFKGAKFDFMRWKGTALAISWGIILVCIALAQPWKGSASKVKLGMQFTGGLDMKVRFRGDIPQDQVRAALVKGGFPDAGVVAYNNSDKSIRDFSVKVKAEKGQDQKDSTLQTTRIRDILKGLDPQAATDPRPSLNTEPVGNLTDRWMKSNPLGVQGDEAALRTAYEAQVAKISTARGRFAPLSSFDQLPGDLNPQLKADLQKEYRLGNLAIVKSESFSPSISGEWTAKTLTAVAWALAAILVYVVFRFTLSFSVGGIVALLHDLLMALGLFVLFGYEFSVPVVASFLILLGYSMADTIVVFDRIRENSHKPEYRRATISQLVNDSINQTLSRTILTSASVLFVSLCLWIWGGPALKDLSFPLVVGVITGTYSSIYIASPVVVYWEKWFPKHDNLKQKHG